MQMGIVVGDRNCRSRSFENFWK